MHKMKERSIEHPLIMQYNVHTQSKTTTRPPQFHQLWLNWAQEPAVAILRTIPSPRHKAVLSTTLLCPNLIQQEFLLHFPGQIMQKLCPMTIHYSQITWLIQNPQGLKPVHRVHQSKGHQTQLRGNLVGVEYQWKEGMSQGPCGCSGLLHMWVLLLKTTNIHGQSSLTNPQFHSKTVSVDPPVQCSQTQTTADLLQRMMWV